MPAWLATVALAAGLSGAPLLWTAPGPTGPAPIDAIACPSQTLCVAADRAGGILWSTDPAGGPRRWARAGVDGGEELTGLACPSSTLCVAVDAAGNALTSTDPSAGRSAWAVARIDSSTTQNNTDNAGAVLVRGVSCPTSTLCVAVDAAGNALISTDPAGGAGAWLSDHIDADRSFGCAGAGLTCQPPLVGIACPSLAECVAVDFSGNVLTTATPAAPAPWASTPVAGGLHSLWSVSCASALFCAAVDGLGAHVISFDPARPAVRTSRSLPGSAYGIWCPSRSLCLASAQTGGGISGLLSSLDPASARSTWWLSPVGGVNAVACLPGAPLCLAADDEGSISVGERTAAIVSALRRELLGVRRLPTIAALDRAHRATFTFSTPIAGQVGLSLTSAGGRVLVASAGHLFRTPGRTRLTLALTAAGRRLFALARGPVRLTGTATFAAATGGVSSTRTLTFRHPPRRRPAHR